ncbi:MAG: hypothetical protein QOG77_3137, partial [Solirubrobacteraceae bacterium]|nr:hypothetical protein [Solirubrobacteraceae bacterium]
VLIAPMIPAPGETPGAWWSATGQDRAMRENDLREGRDPDGAFDVVKTFLHDRAAARRRGLPVEVIDSGHLPALSVPDRVSAQLMV